MKFIFRIFALSIALILFNPANLAELKKESDHGTILRFFDKMYTHKKHTETKKLRSKYRSRGQNSLFHQTEIEKSLSTYSRFLQANNTSTNATTQNTTAGNSEIMETWLRISSYDFLNEKRYPTVMLPELNQFEDIKVDMDRYRINLLKTNDTKKPDLYFYFRMNKDHLYYSATPQDINVLGAIDLEQAKTAKRSNKEDECFKIEMKNNVEYKICAKEFNTRDKWYCGVADRIKIADQFCEINSKAGFKPTFNYEQKVYQPIILVPEASLICNDEFNYKLRGSDWECQCAEGKEQSPINIEKKKAFKSPAAPVFSFDEIEAVSPITSLDGTMFAHEHIKIRYFKGAIRIFHPNFGKIVTLDGTVYHAEEIVFHTPAEHTLDGVRHEMEMQVIAYGQSKGDIAKQVVLSFIFEKKAGIYNKFIDDVDFFNLPNKDFPEKNILNNLFVPKVLFSAESEQIVAMRPFSLYTYQGSITFPPCTERTIHYVAADPIPIAHSMVTMLKEALRDDDTQSEAEIENIRETQPLNGRTVFYYDTSNCRTPQIKREVKEKGHYEKIPKKISQYFYVNGDEPSGLPDTYVVTENEAKGIPEKDVESIESR